MADNQEPIYQSQNPLFNFADLLNYFAADDRTWVPVNIEPDPPPGSTTDDVADAIGSTTNPDIIVNLERNLNTFPNQPERLAVLMDEFQTQWDIRATNFAQRHVTARLNEIHNTYVLPSQTGDPGDRGLVAEILDAEAVMRAKILTELTLD
ncbi:hypothetical protein PT974_04903 [Cladobotryum mycophilum]|uniref:Uncharacterized protein n=1 Tax=Cladobotryum mycophilum TaxID=491253 RepID=A0ABR0SQU8_9HYPO